VEKQKVIAPKARKGAPPMRPIGCLAFSPDGTLIAAGEIEGKIRLFDGRTGEPRPAVLDGHSARVHRRVFSRDGKSLVSVSQEGRENTVKLWDVAAGKVRHTLKTNKHWAVAFSPDGKTLATGGISESEKGKWRSEVILWDARTGERKQTL